MPRSGLLALALLSLLSLTATAETTQCTVISALPATISAPGVYCLKSDFTYNSVSVPAITIAANNVTLDLNAHRIGNLAAGTGASNAGIYALNQQNITVKNGTLRGFGIGVQLTDSASPPVISQGHRVEGIRADQNRLMGISVAGNSSLVRRNQVVDTGGSTLAANEPSVGIWVSGAHDRVLGNDVSGTSAVGTSNAFGIEGIGVEGLMVLKNRVSETTAPGGGLEAGIYLAGSAHAAIRKNVINNASVPPNTALSTGIVMDSATDRYGGNVASGFGAAASGGTPILPAQCAYALSSPSAAVPAVTGSGAFTVNAAFGCAWTSVSNDSWITITSGVFGSGVGPVTYTYALNTATAGQTGSITVGGQTFTVNQSASVAVSVTASDANSNPLSYRWKSTDGVIVDVNAATTTWALPAGPGLHFAYVLVSNGKGGYTERRIVVNTDDIAGPAAARASTSFDAPAAPAPSGGNYFRSFARQDASIFLQNNQTLAFTASASTDARGFFTIPMVPPGLIYYVPCTVYGGLVTDVCGYFEIPNEASQEMLQGTGPSTSQGSVAGLVSLADGSPCGTVNEFFGQVVTARATLLDAGSNVVAGPIRVNAFGNYQLFYPVGGPPPPSLSSIRVQCEAASPVTFPASFTPDAMGRPCCAPVVISDSATVVVSTITAVLNGKSVGTFLPPPPVLPASLKGSDQFLGYKGIDSRLSAWQYYKAIGAIKNYDAAKDIVTGGISFDDWKRKVKLDPYATAGQHDVVATYVNKVDLNLTREHHSISYGPGNTAAYVCNHSGPLDDTQAAIDTAIANTSAGRNQIACVAMDYNVTAGVNGGQPFTRFLIFGPSGQLLPSVNLDGRGEKFVPGSCVVCHGGDRYVGSFPADGTGFADIGAHFLPYDLGNFEFSTTPGLRQADQELAIYLLNQNVLNAGPTVAEQELIAGWYASGTRTLDTNYLPVSWQGHSAVSLSFYQNVYSRNCRTCHVAMTEVLNFDHFSNITTKVGPGIGRDRILSSVCSTVPRHAGAMPNSLRTFNLFWGTAGTAIDKPKITGQYLSEQYFLNIVCAGPR